MSDFILPVVLSILLVVAIVLFAVFGPCIHLGEDDLYCSFCGIQLQNICPECGNTFKSGFFCTACGYEVYKGGHQ